MFLRSNKRFKDGKEHRYYTVVGSRRLSSGKVAQRQVLYLGEINDSQKTAWRKTLGDDGGAEEPVDDAVLGGAGLALAGFGAAGFGTVGAGGGGFLFGSVFGGHIGDFRMERGCWGTTRVWRYVVEGVGDSG